MRKVYIVDGPVEVLIVVHPCSTSPEIFFSEWIQTYVILWTSIVAYLHSFLFKSGLPSYGQSQLQALVVRLRDKKSTEDYDEFLAHSLPFAELELGREVTIDELKQV